jgi:TolB-like protein/DNA-binding winged helix-turn-helix (wHTH) protein/Tfp pilus assembly protein PilF
MFLADGISIPAAVHRAGRNAASAAITNSTGDSFSKNRGSVMNNLGVSKSGALLKEDDDRLFTHYGTWCMASSLSEKNFYRFGVFELNTQTGELSNSGKKVQLRDQPLKLLLALLEQPGELVSRETLVRRLWPDGTFVDFDRGLNKAVLHLRETLGDSAENPRFIETLPRKGYRFVASVAQGLPRVLAAEIPGAKSRPRFHLWAAALVVILALVVGILANVEGARDWISNRSNPTSQITALAVIPLENLSGNPDEEYFADGMTDELITDLAKTSSARITSRTSIMRYKGTRKSVREIGRELNVDAVVEGTVTRSGDRVRITAQLIQVATDMHLWAETYERNLDEILHLQSEVATEIARRISSVVRPLDQGRTVNPQAYGLYLKGRYFFYQYTTEGWLQAIDYFNRALELDPQFAPAYAGLADVYLVAGAYGSIATQEALTRGKSAAAKALQLDDKLAGAHYALATAYTWYDWDWASAEKEFQRGLLLNPNDALGRNWYGGYLSLQGRHEEALDEHERARELDPFSLIINANLVRSLYWGRRYDVAINQARKTLQMNPKFGIALFWLEGSLRHKGMFKEAVALRQAVAPPEKAQSIARKYQTSGFPALLRDSAEMFKKNGALVEAARCFAQVGEKELALSLLEECYRRRCSSMVTLKAEPDFDVLRAEARYQALERQLGLQPF